MANTLLIDVRTPSHVRTVGKILSTGDFDKMDQVIIIAPDHLSIDDWSGIKILYSFVPSSYASLFKIIKLSSEVRKYLSFNDSIYYLSPVNFGPLYDIFKVRFDFKKQFLFEDGISSYLNIKITSRFLKKILISILLGKEAIISKRKFFSGSDEYPTIVYIDKPLLLKGLDVVVEARLIPSHWRPATKEERMTYLISSSSIEYGMCSMERYLGLMKRIADSYQGRPIVVSFHHNEDMAAVKLNALKAFFQIDRIVERGVAVEADINDCESNIEIIAPFNSVALNMLGTTRLSKMSLYDDKGPNMELRKQFFHKLNKVTDMEIDIYE